MSAAGKMDLQVTETLAIRGLIAAFVWKIKL